MLQLLRGAFVWQGGAFSPQDVLLEGARIARVGRNLPVPVGGTELDLQGYYLTGGFADVHVHLREPGFFYKETIASGTRAAARGGYTVVCPMPNLDPTPDTPEHLAVELEAIRKRAVVRTVPYASLTIGRKGDGEPVDFRALADRVVGFSDDGRGVQREAVMRRCMRGVREVDGIVAAHCEDESLLCGGYVHDGDYARVNGHRGIPSESEWRQVERDLRLAAETGCRYHVCHVSTRESVELIRRAKADGVDVTCETAPHYLLLNEWDLMDDGRFKMNPPIRSAADQEALLEGLLDGAIDMIATDHAPHTRAEKSRGLSRSLMGVVGLETAFATLYSRLVLTGRISLNLLMEKMLDAPRRRFRLPGGVRVGEKADLALLDLDKKWRVDPMEFASNGHATPFEGWDVQGETVITWIDGQIVYQRKPEGGVRL